MNEIEKLYKNAGIPKYGKRQCKDSEYLECQNYCFCNMDNKCDKFIIEYPPFTAEKQIELIKWIAHHDGCFKIHLNSIEFGDSGFGSCSTFEESFARAVNNFLKSATEKEKQQVKEILE